MAWKLDRRLFAYNGFCLVALASRDRPLLVPGCTSIDPVLHNDASYLFSTHQSRSAFLQSPDFYIEVMAHPQEYVLSWFRQWSIYWKARFCINLC